MKTTLLTAMVTLTCFCSYAQVKKAAAHQKKKQTAFILKNNLDSTSYAYGVGLVKDIKARGLSKLNYAALGQAITDGIKDEKTMRLTAAQAKTVIADHFKIQFAANATTANNFMAANKTKPGVITLPSGLQYTIVKDASGPKPRATDTVSVNYVGTVIDGKKFDSNDEGKPFVTALDKVIPGWTEGVQLMSVGSKYRFYIPYKLAYGDRAFDGTIIVPYSTLIFDIELLKITPPKADK